MSTIDLPTRPRITDVEAWREHIEAKRAAAHAHLDLERAAFLASLRPEPTPKPVRVKREPSPRKVRIPKPPRVRAPKLAPCIECGHPTRSNNLKAADYPGTRPRARAGKCTTCAERPNRPRTGTRTPRVTPDEAASWVTAYLSGTSAADIARATGRNPITVRAQLRRAGVVIVRANASGRAGGLSPEERAKVAQRRRSGVAA